ncbi:hypothetical protein ABZW18_19960 [Streptomyces sp. NPDC004647]|uniref:hypothetical protein n=1 Tax=Streptomyces sp. NPDC004647 TaxID=3154671 RepID=UPI0033B8C746
MSRAYSRIFKAAAAMSVVGALAFAFQLTGDEGPVQAESGSRYDPAPDLAEPNNSDRKSREEPGKADASEDTGLSPTSSAEPEVLPTANDASVARTRTASTQEPSAQRGGAAGAPTSEAAAPGTADRQADHDAGRSAPEQSPSGPAEPTSAPEQPQDEDDSQGEDSTPQQGTVGGTVGGLLGGVGHSIDGLLGH